MDRERRRVTVRDGSIPLPEPFADIVCADYPRDVTTQWSRLTYRRWPLLTLSSAELTASRFEPVARTEVADGRVPVPPAVADGTGLEATADAEGAVVDGTGVTLLSQGRMLTGDVTAAYVMTLGQSGALSQIYPLLPTPE